MTNPGQAQVDYARFLRGIRQGDIATLEKLYDYYAHRLYHYLLVLLGSESDAEDVLQALFLKLIRMRGRMKSIKDLTAYLFTSARHEALRLIDQKKQAQQVAGNLMKALPLEAGPDTTWEEAEVVNRALMSLPPEQREVVMLKIYQGFSFKQISELIGIPLDTAASRYRYGLRETARADKDLKDLWKNT